MSGRDRWVRRMDRIMMRDEGGEGGGLLGPNTEAFKALMVEHKGLKSDISSIFFFNVLASEVNNQNKKVASANSPLLLKVAW